jgi:hypothetical protein
MHTKRLQHPIGAAALCVMLAGQLAHTLETTDEGTITPDMATKVFLKPGYSPYAGRNYPTRPLFGDTHLHTSQSFDAIAFGTRLRPDEAYRLARGEEVVSSTGVRVKLSRPLDFLVVADHAESMGIMGEVLEGNPELMGDLTIRHGERQRGSLEDAPGL